MVGWSINEIQEPILQPQAVSSYADLATFKALMSMGAYCRKVAKSRLNKKSTQYQSVAEMPPAFARGVQGPPRRGIGVAATPRTS